MSILIYTDWQRCRFLPSLSSRSLSLSLYQARVYSTTVLGTTQLFLLCDEPLKSSRQRASAMTSLTAGLFTTAAHRDAPRRRRRAARFHPPSRNSSRSRTHTLNDRLTKPRTAIFPNKRAVKRPQGRCWISMKYAEHLNINRKRKLVKWWIICSEVFSKRLLM